MLCFPTISKFEPLFGINIKGKAEIRTTHQRPATENERKNIDFMNVVWPAEILIFQFAVKHTPYTFSPMSFLDNRVPK